MAIINIGKSEKYHTHIHEHNRPDPLNQSGKPVYPDSDTDHHNPYEHHGGTSGYHKHEHRHRHFDPERQQNMDDTDVLEGPARQYFFDEKWFRNPLDYTENRVGTSEHNEEWFGSSLNYAENHAGSWGDDVNWASLDSAGVG